MPGIADYKKVAIDKLIPYVNNARTHSDDQITRIASSIREFGFLSPCVIDAEYNVIAGHGRILAAKKLGLVDVPCVFVEGLTDAQRKAYILADNRLAEFADWDQALVDAELDALMAEGFDVALTGFDVGGPQVREDDYNPELPDVPKSQRGNIWQLGRHYLMCGDSTSVEDVEKLMQGKKADMLLTDPPYNVNVKGKAGTIANDNLSPDEFKSFLKSAFYVAKQTLRAGGVYHIWHGCTSAGAFFGALEDVGLLVRQVLIWIKNQSTLGRQDFQWQHEPCLAGDMEDPEECETEDPEAAIYGWTEGTHKWYKKRREKTLLYFDKPQASAKHPTMKPVKLFDYEMQCNTKPGEIVLDLFGGSGTTIIAAEQNGRCAYLMEFDPKYCDVIIDRWEKFTGERAEMLNG